MGGVEKACLRVGGKSLLQRHFESFAGLGACAGRVSVVWGREPVLRETLRLGGRPVKSRFPGAPGTLGSFMSCFPSGGSIVVHGDLVWEPALAEAALSAPGDAVVPVQPGPADPEAMKAAVADGVLLKLSKGIPPEQCSGESMGMFLFRESCLPALRRCCGRALDLSGGNAALDDAVTLLAGECLVRAVMVNGPQWDEIDTPSDLERVRCSVRELR